MTDGPIVRGGQFWGRLTPDGPLVPVEHFVGEPDAWICRRVADYPKHQIPTGGAVAACHDCGAAIVFNPARTVAARKVCMQCASIRPLPMDEERKA